VRMKAFVYAVVLIFISLTTQAQENILVWNETTSIQWQDFSGTANDTSHFDAEVFTEVRYSYKFISLADFSFDVQAIFNKNTSWAKEVRKSESLLKHEQVHFDIAELYAMKLSQA